MGVVAAWDLSRYPLYGGTAQLFVSADYGDPPAGGAECVIEAGQITNTSEQMPLLEGNGGVKLHQAANGRVGLYGTPAQVVSVNLLDLAHADGLRFPYPQIQLGAPVLIEDPEDDLNVVQSRIVGWNRDWKRRLLPSVELSNERADMTKVLAGRAKPPRHQSSLVPTGTRGITYPP